MRPNLLIAGCGKCGTTTVAYLLGQHPDIYMSRPKEPNFLSYENIYEKGWDWYESLFLEGSECKIRGEASVSYSLKEYENKVMERIHKNIPEIKIIYIARNPYKRFESVYMEHHDSGYKYGWLLPYTLHEAADYRPEMLTNSLYWQRTEYMRKILPEENILYLCLEDLIESPEEFLTKCFEFLEVNTKSIPLPDVVQKNRSSSKSYDTKLLRFLKSHKKIYNLQPGFLKNLENKYIRHSFNNKKLFWDNEFKQYFVNLMKKDVNNYLKKIKKPADFWGEDFI